MLFSECRTTCLRNNRRPGRKNKLNIKMSGESSSQFLSNGLTELKLWFWIKDIKKITQHGIRHRQMNNHLAHAQYKGVGEVADLVWF